MSEPLTREEEADLRERVLIRGQHIDNLAVARLLTTLDAERARPVHASHGGVSALRNHPGQTGIGLNRLREAVLLVPGLLDKDDPPAALRAALADLDAKLKETK